MGNIAKNKFKVGDRVKWSKWDNLEVTFIEPRYLYLKGTGILGKQIAPNGKVYDAVLQITDPDIELITPKGQLEFSFMAEAGE